MALDGFGDPLRVRPFRKTVIEVFWRPTDAHLNTAMMAEGMADAVEQFLADNEVDGAAYVMPNAQ